MLIVYLTIFFNSSFQKKPVEILPLPFRVGQLTKYVKKSDICWIEGLRASGDMHLVELQVFVHSDE